MASMVRTGYVQRCRANKEVEAESKCLSQWTQLQWDAHVSLRDPGKIVLSTLCLRGSSQWPRNLDLATQVQHLVGVPGFWLPPDSTLAVTEI